MLATSAPRSLFLSRQRPRPPFHSASECRASLYGDTVVYPSCDHAGSFTLTVSPRTAPLLPGAVTLQDRWEFCAPADGQADVHICTTSTYLYIYIHHIMPASVGPLPKMTECVSDAPLREARCTEYRRGQVLGSLDRQGVCYPRRSLAPSYPAHLPRPSPTSTTRVP